MSSDAPKRLRVAIIGSGISGLVVAHRLHPHHDITIIEKGAYVGGHTNTVTVDDEGTERAVDTGFIVFNEKTYPNFCTLIEELGVASKPTDMSFAVRCDRTGVEYSTASGGALFAQKRNLVRPRFWGMLKDIASFGRHGSEMVTLEDSVSLEQYIRERGYGKEFVERYLLPLGSSLWSCAHETFLSFPARFVADFLHNHGMFAFRDRPQWRVIQGGSKQYVRALTSPFEDRIRTNTAVSSVRRSETDVTVSFADGMTETFDEVVMACHADQSLRLLDDPTRDEMEILPSFPYERNEAVLHTGTESVMPRRRNVWGAWNYRVPADETKRATVTYNMNHLQGFDSNRTFCVTLNDADQVPASDVLRRIEYHHPTYDHRRTWAQSRHREVIRSHRTSFCGAYWGFGFHEDGVKSGLRVAEAFGL
ncbi:MAG: FAD-dependent oxidoreductase [Planctomycetota bacterium]